MSEVVEDRVVSMEFDNKNFEKNVKTSLSTLDRLKLSLATLSGTASSISNFAMMVKGITFDPVNEQVQIGIGKLAGLTAALTGVVNISDELYNVITKTIRSFSFEQIEAGFSKYEQKTSSIQTIMNAVRKEGETEEETLARIMPYMDQLSWFTDETSFNFTDMVANIGRFTSAGTELDKTVTAMEGIALWGAKAGVSATGVSTAMLQLSQALGRGHIMVEDWKSIETLHMDTAEFKQQAIETAVALGTLKKQGEKFTTMNGKATVSVSSFREALRQGWLTTDVLMTVLNKYGEYVPIINELQEDGETASEAMRRLAEDGKNVGYEFGEAAFKAGMEAKTLTEAIEATRVAVASKFSDIYETIFGDFIEARDLWTSLSEQLWNIFAGPLDILKGIMVTWKEMGGREKLFKSFARIWSSLSGFMEKVSESWSNVFGTLEGKGYGIITKITQAIDIFTIYVSNLFNTITNNDKIWDNLEKGFKGIKRYFDIIRTNAAVLKERIIIPFVEKYLPKIIEKASEFFGKFGDFMKEMADKIIEFDAMNKAIDFAIELYKEVADRIRIVKEEFKGLTTETAVQKIGDVLNQINTILLSTNGPLDKITEMFKTFIGFLGESATTMQPIVQRAWDTLKQIFGGLYLMISNLGPSFKTAIGWIKTFFESLSATMSSFMSQVSSGEKSALEALGDWFAEGIKYMLKKLEDVDVDRLNKWLDTIIKIIQIIDVILVQILEIVAIIKLMRWNTNRNANITAIFNPIVALGQTLSSMLGTALAPNTIASIASMVAAIAAVQIAMAASLFIIAMIPTEKLIKAAVVMTIMIQVVGAVVAGITILLNKMTSMDKILDGAEFLKEGRMPKKGEGKGLFDIHEPLSLKLGALASVISSMASAVLLMSISALLLSTIDYKTSLRTIIELTYLLVSVAGAVIGMAKLMNGGENESTKIATIGTTFTAIAISLFILTSAVKKMADIDNLLDGISGITFLMGALVGMLYSIKRINNDEVGKIVIVSLFALILSKSMINMSKAIKRLAKLDTDSMVNSAIMLNTMIGYIMLLALLAHQMTNNNTRSLLAIAVIVGVVTLSMFALVESVEKISKIKDPERVTKSLLALSGIASGLVVLVEIMVLLSKQLLAKGTSLIDKDKVGALLVLSSLLVIMIAPIKAITSSLIELASSGASGADLTAAAFAIGGVFGALAFIVSNGAKFGSGDSMKGILAIASGITILALALKFAAPAIQTLASVNWEALMPAMLAITAVGVSLMAVAGNAKLMGTFINNLSIVTTEFLKFGAAAMMIGAALYLFAISTDKATETLLRLVNQSEESVKHVVDIITVILRDHIPAIYNAFTSGLGKMLNPVDGSYVITQLLTRINDMIIESLYQTIPKVVKLIDLAFNEILDILGVYGPLINKFLYVMTDDLFGYIMVLLFKYVPIVNKQMEEATWDLFLRILALLNRGIPLLNAELAKEAINLIYWINHVIEGAADIIIHGIIHILELLRDNIDTIEALLIEIVMTSLLGLLKGLVEGVEILYPKMLELFDSILDLMNKIVEADWDEFVETLEKLADKTLDIVNKWVVKECDVGGKIWDIMLNLFKGLRKAALYHAAYGPFSPITIGKKIGGALLTGMKSALRINSPSKATEEIAMFSLQGLGKGFEKAKNFLSPILTDVGNIITSNFTETFGSMDDITANLGGGLLDGIKSTLTGDSIDFGGLLGSLTNLNPTITPNLDLSNIKSGTELMNQMLGSDYNVKTDAFDSVLSSMFNRKVDAFGNINDIAGMFNTPGMGKDSVTQKNNMDKIIEKMDNFIDVQRYSSENRLNNDGIKVVLEGDAKKMLKVLKVEDNKQIKATGVPTFSKK